LKNKRIRNSGLLFLRLSAALTMFLGHGWPKAKHLLSGEVIQFADPLGIGVSLSFILVILAESICMLAVILGLFTRLFLIPPIIDMAVAFFIFHAHDPYYQKELSLLYLLLFLSVFLIGSGRYALQSLISKKPTFKNRLGHFLTG
jgi:putative oxidoreductase